jgi:hypothetical protein
MEEGTESRELKDLIVRDLELQKEEDILTEDNQDEILKRLTEIINRMLAKDYHRLVNAMYRLDINEKLFREAISGMHSPNVASRLAELVLNREKEKIEMRKKYKS